MENEIWKDIKGFEGLYQVSNLGRVKSLERKVSALNNGTKCLKRINERILCQKTSYQGYKIVLLYNNKKRKYCSVHRLVATAFIPNPNNKPCIDHFNCIRSDNRVSNLRWCTIKENCNNPLTLINKSNLRKGIKQRPEVIEKRFKKVYQYTLDGELVKVWDSVKEAQQYYNNTHISSCARGERKKCVNYKWFYNEQ